MVIALVPCLAIGGVQVLHLICDLSIASENAIFGQTGPRVGSFDAVLDLVIWQDLLVKEKQKKFGFYVENIIPRKLLRWA